VLASTFFEVDYSPAYNVMKVRLNPSALILLDGSVLRSTTGEPGLLGEYFDLSRYKDNVLNMEELGGELVGSRIDSRIDFNWGGGSPMGELGHDWFGVRWTGKIGPFPQSVRLVTVTDDGVRLWIDGQKVIDAWVGQAPTPNYTGELEADRVYDVRLEYFEADGGASCMFGYLLPTEVADAINSAEIQLLAPDGKELLKKQIKWEGKQGELQLDVPVLPEGTYTVVATLPGMPQPVTRTIASRRSKAVAAKADVGKNSYSGRFKVGEATFTVDSYRVSVATERYIVEFLDLGISQITDKKTGQQYCLSDGMNLGSNASLFLKSYMPAQPARTFRHLPAEDDAQVINVKRLPRGVEYTITGLVHPGNKETRRYHPEAMLGLRIEFDAATGDLLLTSLANAGVEEKFGVYDEGIFATGFNVGTFKYDIKLINPSGSVAPVSSFRGWTAWWPVNYQASLMLLEAPGGECLAIWADDESLEFGRKFRIDDGTVEFHTVNADATWRVGEIEAPIWRVNLFDSWEPAAMRYREVMERTLGIKKIEEREPARARSIRIVTHSEAYRVDRLKRYFVDNGVPVEALMGWETQGWLAGYGREFLSQKRGLWYPNYPAEKPTHYLGHPRFKELTAQSQEFGVPVFPYTLMFYGMSEPFASDSKVLRGPDMDFRGAGRMWWVLYTKMMKELADRYDLQGIYNDCSWVGPRHDPRGKVDGLTVYQAHVKGRQYMRDRLLPTAFMGERQHEITIVSDFIALLWPTGEVHPINHYLFGPYTWRFNQREIHGEMSQWFSRGRGDTQPLHRVLDASESLTVIPAVGSANPVELYARQETALVAKRMLFWGQQMLTPYFPERYEPGVLAYLRGKDGTEYRTKSGDGMGLVRLTDGGEEIVWWRTRNVSETDCKGAAIDGWVAYNGNRAIGLDRARRYVLLEENERPPVLITSMPDGAYLTLSRVQDGYWVAAVDGADLPERGVHLQVVGQVRTFVGASAKSTEAGVYHVTVAPGSAFAVCWNRTPEAVAELPFALDKPASRMEFVADTGLPVFSEDAAPLKNKITGKQHFLSWQANFKGHSMQADYLLKLPAAPATLKATAVDAGGFEKAAVRVRVNGKIIAEIQHTSGEQTPIEVSLAEFAGQTILLTFDTLADGQFGIQDPVLSAVE